MGRVSHQEVPQSAHYSQYVRGELSALLSQEGAQEETTDKRLLRGARTRQAVLRQAVDIASLEGLGSVSFGRLATDTGLSKAGVQTLFRTKEALQLAVISYAREKFIDAVVLPALAAPPGTVRLRALLDHWIAYAETPLFAGGCFRAANLAAYDSQSGPVHDALFKDHEEWIGAIADELRVAMDAGEIAEGDTGLTAFHIDALLCAANTALRVGDDDATNKVRRIVEGLLAPPH